MLTGLCCCLRGQDDLRRAYNWSKWAYCVCFTLVSIATWILRDFGDDFLLEHNSTFTYCSNPATAALCSGKEVAVRFSFANFSFFALHAILLLCCKSEEDPRVALHASLWGLRLLIWAGALVGFMFVPSSAIAIYGQIARIGAGVFLVFIMIEMVSWFYDVNDWLIAKDTRGAWAVLICGTVVCFAGGLVIIGFSYHLYAPTASCSLNIFFITWSLIMGFALVGVLFVPGRLESAGLLTSGSVFLYCSYLLISALASQPEGSCTLVTTDNSRSISIVGFILAIAAVCYSTVTLGTSHIMGGSSGTNHDVEALTCAELPYRADFFHVVFALASMYMAMIMSNWEISTNTEEFELNAGWISTWVKMGSKWLCELLYMWSVVAPRLLPNRDFGQ